MNLRLLLEQVCIQLFRTSVHCQLSCFATSQGGRSRGENGHPLCQQCKSQIDGYTAVMLLEFGSLDETRLLEAVHQIALAMAFRERLACDNKWVYSS